MPVNGGRRVFLWLQAVAAPPCAGRGRGPVAAREFRRRHPGGELPTVQALRYMDQLVTERTGGRHRIRFFHSGSWARKARPSSRRASAPSTSTASMWRHRNSAPILNVLALPFLFRSIEHLHKVVDGPIGRNPQRLETNGFTADLLRFRRALDLYVTKQCARWRPQRIAAARAAVRPDGQHDPGARAEPSGSLWQVLTACRPTRRRRRNNWPSFVTSGHHKVARYYTVTRHTMGLRS